jgi:pyrrolysine biosynthesis protein PylD
MTRLSHDMLREISQKLDQYNSELRRKTGHSLKEIACHGACFERELCTSDYRLTAAIIPISSGEGIIDGFSEAVRGIIDYIGFPAFVTDKSDIAGIAQAIEKGADVLFVADDRCFVAINLKYRHVVYNSEATARGYVAALDYLAEGLEKKEVLIIGAGKVGNAAAEALKSMRADIAVFDIDRLKTKLVANKFDAKIVDNLDDALYHHTFILDVSPADNIIRAEHIKPQTRIAECGIPTGIMKDAFSLVEEHLVHDPLQIGVATMMMLCCHVKNRKGGGSERSHRP